ncbi:Myc-type basic helix-loop-helix (bHLH) domain-containing protein [Dioscorea alata]|uniref:Myc-type basic helix-loop-helix (BHLH) domain-containing protein n=1 Tax=Dioscorea alata TaxID=55571 RepID=A0ACB7V3G0_DIOAL|nr:Myc-type basic helix-loop-helix (bHLH) domain-containing protein [Dioscorea alata]
MNHRESQGQSFDGFNLSSFSNIDGSDWKAEFVIGSKTTTNVMVDNKQQHKSKRQKIVHAERLIFNKSLKNQQIITSKRSKKLGDKITTLQHLVSPFGKTDTASVLNETAVCIKLLHEQIKVLTSPYFQIKSLTFIKGDKEDLVSRGLCLVPFSANNCLKIINRFT